MSRSTWLIARAIWWAFFIVLCVFFGLNFVFRVLDELKSPHAQYLFSDALWVSLAGMPRRLYLDLPLMVLIAVAAGLGGLAQSSELTVLRAAGLSTSRIFTKVIWALSPILVCTWVVAEIGMPEAEQFSQSHRQTKTEGPRPAVLWTREGADFVQVSIRTDGSIRRWLELQFNPESRQLQALVESKEVQWKPGAVQLSSAGQTLFSTETIEQTRSSLTRETGLSPTELQWLARPPDTLSWSELASAITYLQAEGLHARAHLQLFWQRVFLPPTLVVLALLASASAFGSLRSMSMSTRVFSAVVVGLVFKYAMDMASPAVFLAGGHPAWAMVLPLLVPVALTPWLFSRR